MRSPSDVCAYHNLEKGSVDGWFEPARTLNGRRVGPGAPEPLGRWGVWCQNGGQGNTELNDVRSSKGPGAHQAPFLLYRRDGEDREE